VITFEVQPQGERFTFFSEPDPTAPSVEFEFVGSPGTPGPDPHIHARQVETFRVTSGEMLAKVGKEERRIRAGETLVVPAGQVHSFCNPDPDNPLIIRITLEPALNFQWFMTEMSRLANENGGRWKDIPLLEMAWAAHQVIDEHDLPGVPRFITRPAFALLAGVAFVLGKHRRISPKPSGPAVAGT